MEGKDKENELTQLSREPRCSGLESTKFGRGLADSSSFCVKAEKKLDRYC